MIDFKVSDCQQNGDNFRVVFADSLSRTLSGVKQCNGNSLHSTAIGSYLEALAPSELFGIIPENMFSRYRQSIEEVLSTFKPVTGLEVLVPWLEPPKDVRRYDGTVTGFISSASLWRAAAGEARSLPLNKWCFLALNSVLAGRCQAEYLSVKQLPIGVGPCLVSDASAPEIVAVVPHRGPGEYLSLSLAYLSAMTYSGKIRHAVGLDVDDSTPYRDLFCKESTDIYMSDELPPVGPYVFRQAMIEDATEALALFQDSDDLSCTNRASVLWNELAAYGVDMVGSHELEVNEIDGTVRAYRFPLEVSSALSGEDTVGVSDSASEAVLHATCMIRREAFLRAGGFSTNRRIANDSQFLLRASFSLKIRNADAFLYIRRVHPRALTVAPETHHGNTLRQNLSREWGADFVRIKRGELDISASSLRAIRGDYHVRLQSKSARSQRILRSPACTKIPEFLEP